MVQKCFFPAATHVFHCCSHLSSSLLSSLCSQIRPSHFRPLAHPVHPRNPLWSSIKALVRGFDVPSAPTRRCYGGARPSSPRSDQHSVMLLCPSGIPSRPLVITC